MFLCYSKSIYLLLILSFLGLTCGNKVEPSDQKEDVSVNEEVVEAKSASNEETEAANADQSADAESNTEKAQDSNTDASETEEADEPIEAEVETSKPIEDIKSNTEPVDVDQEQLTADLELTISASEIIGSIDLATDQKESAELKN